VLAPPSPAKEDCSKMNHSMNSQAANLVDGKTADCRPIDESSTRLRKGRSKITNGSSLLPGVDGRSPWVRRAKDIIASHLSDLGGEENTSAAERSRGAPPPLARRDDTRRYPERRTTWLTCSTMPWSAGSANR
jgi:hypothetical protein